MVPWRTTFNMKVMCSVVISRPIRNAQFERQDFRINSADSAIRIMASDPKRLTGVNPYVINSVKYLKFLR